MGPSGISVGNGVEKQPPLKEQHDILNEFVGAPGSDRPPHMELPTENPDGPKNVFCEHTTLILGTAPWYHNPFLLWDEPSYAIWE
jgi:hypothetical protein